MVDSLTVVSGTPSPTSFGIPGTENVIDPTFNAQRVRQMPSEYNSQGFGGGHFRVAVPTGALTGVAAAGTIFSARWAPAANSFMLLKRIQAAMIITTAFTTAQAVDLDVIAQRAFTAADTGGTPITPITGNSQKVRSQFMQTSTMADMRISTTAALGAGTKTADSFAFGITGLPNTNALATGTALVDLYKEDAQAQHPVMFGPNEGFNVRMVTAMGAVGVIKVYLAVEWAEVPGL